MVFKISKGGVRTGNTLRGLHTARSRRYSRHACILGCTSLGKRDLGRLICDSSDEDEDTQMVRETLNKTNVLLSLNKQQRWRLPAMIGHMIKQGEFNKGALVSLLERHKLKRRANCFKLVTNSKKFRNISPKQKKYFSFSLDSFGDDESNRQKRRARAEEMKVPLDKQSRISKTLYKTVEAYTSDGIMSSQMESLRSNKPEYRLEVFYPCPQSCSLTYNPKYTDVIVAEGKNGKMEVKSNVKTKKKGASKHRKRLLLKDMDRLYSEAIQEDVDELWDDYEETFEEDEEYDNRLKASDKFTIDNSIIQMLIAQAQKTREFCENKKKSIHRSTRKSKFQNIDKTEEKSHTIVYVNQENPSSSQLLSNSASNNVFTSSDKITEDSKLVFGKAIFASSEICPEELRQLYGARYVEASCQPRRFVIDVTEDITNVLATSNAMRQNIDFSSYLVCIFDGVYDEGLMVYRFALNSMIRNKLQDLTDAVPFTKLSIAEIINCMACHILDQKEKNCIDFADKNIAHMKTSKYDFLNSRLKLKVEVFDRHGKQNPIFSDNNNYHPDSEIHKTPSQFSEDFDEEHFCDVCYASFTSSKLDSVDVTKLNICGHLLCNECWAAHFRTNMKDGKTVISCGGYDCNTEIEMATLMSILDVSEIKLILQRKEEQKLESMENAKYCPHPECGRVIVVESSSEDTCVDVACACGNKLCFSCFGPAHWPAKCEQAEEYTEKLPEIKPDNENDEEKAAKPAPLPVTTNPTVQKKMTVEGRICPKCLGFIYKDGGCRHMRCKCGHVLCWDCMRPYHNDYCKKDPFWLYNHTRVVIVRHASAQKIVSIDSVKDDEKPTVQKNRKKSSLYQRALHQREEGVRSGKMKSTRVMTPLICKMVKAARQDLGFKKEIAESLKLNPPFDDETSLSTLDVTSYLEKFMKTIVNMSEELHHVTEYTFILLQGTPHCSDKQRILKLANDLTGFCSFVRSILQIGDKQDARAAFRRLISLQKWAKRALDALIITSHSLRSY